jgi:hypothetical protein
VGNARATEHRGTTSNGALTTRLANRAERRGYQTLTEQLQPNDLLIPGQRVTDHLKDHEIDFVVAIEGAGIVCLEVKGGEVWHDGNGWCPLRGGKHVHIEPVRQAREACYALRDYIESDARWTLKRPRWDHVVVLPNTKLPDDKPCRPARLPSGGSRSSTRATNRSREMDFYVVIPDDQPGTPPGEKPIKHVGYSGDDAAYWIEPGGVLVAGGLNDDSMRRWRVYAPGAWIQVQSDEAPVRSADLRNGTDDDPSTGRHFG